MQNLFRSLLKCQKKKTKKLQVCFLLTPLCLPLSSSCLLAAHSGTLIPVAGGHYLLNSCLIPITSSIQSDRFMNILQNGFLKSQGETNEELQVLQPVWAAIIRYRSLSAQKGQKWASPGSPDQVHGQAPADAVSWGAHVLVHSLPSSLCPHVGRSGEGALLGVSFMKALILSMKVPPS